MTSLKQLEANRRNALKSTGPRTLSGKKVSSQNSTKHGLLAKHIVISGEYTEEYGALKEELFDDLAPQGAIECELTDMISAHAWRLRRAKRLEAALITHQRLMDQKQSLLSKLRDLERDAEFCGDYDQDEDDDEEGFGPQEAAQYDDISKQLDQIELQLGDEAARLGEAFLDFCTSHRYQRAMVQLNRYETSIERAFYRALHELQRIQAMRAGRQTTAPIAIDVQVDDSGDSTDCFVGSGLIHSIPVGACREISAQASRRPPFPGS